MATLWSAPRGANGRDPGNSQGADLVFSVEMSTARDKNVGRMAEQPAIRGMGWFAHATGVVFTSLAVLMLFAALGNAPPLTQRDALFEVKTQTVLWLAGLLHLGLGGYLLLGKDLGSRGFLALWAGVNYIVYYLGVVHGMKVAAPFPVEVLVAWEAGLSSKAVDTLWRGFSVYLVLGGLTLIVVERRQVKQLAAARFLERWKELHQQPVTKPISRPQHDPSARAETAKGTSSGPTKAASGTPWNLPAREFKFSCPNCGQHICCDQGYAGRQIHCPACRHDIQVPEPTR